MRWFALVLLTLSSCTRGGNGYYGATEPKHGSDEAWANMTSEPETIDPGKAAEQIGGTLAVNLFAGLTQGHPQSLEPMPEIAERWEISDDGLHYVFHLRESTWSDGVPLTAADFVYTWRRVLDPKTGSRYASFLFGLKHGELFNRRALRIRGIAGASESALRALIEPLASIEQLTLDPALDAAFVIVAGDDSTRPKHRERLLRELNGRAWNGRTLQASEMDGSEVGVHAEDERTLRVELEAPLPFFLHITKYYTALPVPRHVIERLQREGKDTELWTRPEHIVSNGPYLLAEARFRQSMRLEKNPRYWDAQHVKLQRIRLPLIENYNTTLNMYEAGELDAIGPGTTLPAEFLDVLRTQRDFVSAPYMSVYFYWVNHKIPPLDNPLVRQALSLGDRSRQLGQARHARGPDPVRGHRPGRPRRLRRDQDAVLRSRARACAVARGGLQPGSSAAADHAALQHLRRSPPGRRSGAGDVAQASRHPRGDREPRVEGLPEVARDEGLPARSLRLDRRLSGRLHVSGAVHRAQRQQPQRLEQQRVR
jgi:oligopeptide transport system substrate-binding protein